MPDFLFKPIHYAWLQTLLAPLNNLYAGFLTFRSQQLADATINSSVNRLTQALWDKYDPTKSIYLVQTDAYISESFIYLESEGATPSYDYLESEDHEPFEFDYLDNEFSTNYNFIVRIPIAMVASSAAIYAFVKPYVFSGISFTIETF